MFVKSLKLNNFRNYSAAAVEFCSGVNLISGLNGQGKTNLVEAIMFGCLSKSPRVHQDTDLIKFGEETASANIVATRKFGDVKIDYFINKNEENAFFVNNNKIDRVSQLFGNLVGVYFSPQELKIVLGSPSDRRDFCDTDISMLSEAYYNLLLRYDKVLAQRNKLLKTERDHAKIIDTIGVWDEQLASIAAPIIKTRKSFIMKLTPFAQDYIKQISNDKEELKIDYVGASGDTTDEIKTTLLKQLELNLSRDMELGYTSVGPHRDDIKFELGGTDVRLYSSQGQARSIVLALKLAEVKIMEAEIGEKPIMIFDDVFSELDGKRQQKLYECLDGAQAIFTGTNFKFKPQSEYLAITVKNGAVKAKKLCPKI